MSRTIRPVLVVAVILMLAAGYARGRLAAQASSQGFSFTAAQADRGADEYARHCASCHGRNLDDGPYAPALKGNDFRLVDALADWAPQVRRAAQSVTDELAARLGPGRT